MTENKDSLFTLAATGVLSYIIADIVHEVVGHGGTSWIIGNRIELLTAVYFKSSPANFLVDVGGPIANLIAGISIFLYIKKKQFYTLLLFQIAAFNFFWFSGTVIGSGFRGSGDWIFAMKEMGVGMYSKIVLIFSGVGFYIIFIHILNRYLEDFTAAYKGGISRRSEVFISFLFASAGAITAGLFFQPERLDAALECWLETMAFLPILFLNYKKKGSFIFKKVHTNIYYLLFTAIIFLCFCFTLGKGIY